MDFCNKHSRSPQWGSSLMAQSPTGRMSSGPWDGAFASSPASVGSPTLYIDSSGLCFEELANLALNPAPSISTERITDPPSPRTHRMELARAMGISMPQKGKSEPVQERSIGNGANTSKRGSNDALRRSANLNQPRKMN